MPASVAIIMRAKDEMPYIVEALAQLKLQTIQDYRFQAVDSGSTDGTLEALQAFGASPEQIKPGEYVPGPVLNNAISRTTEAIIVLLNADAIPRSTDWLERLIAPIAEGSADATFSKQLARPDAHFIVAYDYERAYDTGRMAPGFFSAVACAFKRELWESHRFRESGYAEDTAWAACCIADGARFLLVENSVVEHSHNYTLKGLFRKRYRQAVTLNDNPSLFRQLYYCMREIVRDLLYAIRRFKPHTIPYNVMYRITIHGGVYQGLRDAAKCRRT